MKWLIALFAISSLEAFERIDPKYQIRYGDGALEVVEYFSLSCRKCLELFVKDFGGIRADYIDTHQASWVFHPTPADLATLQMMACLEKLQPDERTIFFEAVMESVAEKGPKHACLLMQAAMRALGSEMPDLDKIEFLEKTAAFENALSYLKQEGVVSIVPSVEIDGKLLEKVPTRTLLDAQLRNL